MNRINRFSWLPLLALLGMAGFALAETPVDLPALIEGSPTQAFDVLSPIGAGKKSIDLARTQLQLEAKKVDADAVIRVVCEPGGMGRQGLTWYPKDAYCRGLAVRFKSPSQAGAATTQLPFDPNRFK